MAMPFDDGRLANAIQAVIRTAKQDGHTVDVKQVTDRLLVDFDRLHLDRGTIYRLVAAECAKHAGLACVLENAD